MNYLNKVQYKMFFLIISLIITPQVFAQSSKSMFSKVNSLRTPVIQTDKRNYETGENVDIAGVDFLVYERVSLNVKYFHDNLSQEIPLSSWDVYADAKGRISGQWQVFDVGDAGSRFIIEATGTISGATSKTEISTDPLAGEAVNLSQCANSNATPQNLDCPETGPSGWVTGVAGNSKARYFEGDSIAYRNIVSGLTVGDVYKWTVLYDTTKGGINAIDYLTTYNRTITNANPCANGGVANGFCTPGPADDTFPIPVDPVVTAGRGTPIVQIPGVFSAWGGDITAVSVPTYTGTYPGGDSTASVDITFTANASTVVLAWGGHISTRADWGQAFGSINITGSPYHTSNGGLMLITAGGSCCTGSQDLSLQSAAVAPTARIIIIKHATPFSTYSFGFTTTNLSPSTFNLVDNSNTTDPSQIFDNISTFDVKRIEETTLSPYSLVSIVCTVDIGTGGTPAPVRTGNAIDIDIKSGDQVTCTFNNDFTTAAAVSVSGRVFDSNGIGLPRSYVSVTDGGGNVRSAITNQFGYYRFDEIEAGESLVFNVWNKSYTFQPQFVNVSESLSNVNFYPQ